MQTIYDDIASIQDLNSRIVHMSTIDLKREAQPWCFTQYFWDVKDADDPMNTADEIAQAFKARNGLTIIEAESSYCCGKFITIMDEFDHCDTVGNWLLKRAFKKAGFKYAAECDEDELRVLYAQARYDEFRQ